MGNLKVVVITGGRSGIGKAISQKFLSEGYLVYSTSRGEDLAYDHPNHFHVTLDLNDDKSLSRFGLFIEGLERLDCFVNNAGCYYPELSTNLTNDNISKTIQVNLSAPIKICKFISKKMIVDKSGKILFISSIASMVSKEKSAVYSSTKAGILGLNRTLAIELASSNILVNALSPGPTHTPMVDRLIDQKTLKNMEKNIPLGRLAQTDEIAKIAFFLCSNNNTYITGQNIIADGGFTCR